MSDHPNEHLAMAAWNAVADGDVDRLEELVAPDLVWHVTGQSPWKGTHLGVAAAAEYLAAAGDSGRAYRTRLDDVLVSDDYASLVCQVSSKRGDRVLEVGYVLLLRIADRRIAEVWTLALDPDEVARFWAEDGG